MNSRLQGQQKRVLSARGSNLTTLFMEDINLGTPPSRLMECWIWDHKDWRLKTLLRFSSNCKQWANSFFRQAAAAHQQGCYCLTGMKSWGWTPRLIGRLTVGGSTSFFCLAVVTAVGGNRTRPLDDCEGKEEEEAVFSATHLKPQTRFYI